MKHLPIHEQTSDRPAWGKYESPHCYHRLEHHCADVAACFEILLQEPILRRRFERALGNVNLCAVTEARLTAIAFLHDFGKLNAGFQFKVHDRSELPTVPPQSKGHIVEAFFCCQQDHMCKALGFYDIATWGEGLEPLLIAALAHHGRPAQPPHSGSGPPEIWSPFAGYDPVEAASLLYSRIRTWFPAAFEQGPPLPDSPELVHLFAGIVALADQIGSAKEFFSFEPDPDPEYIIRARKKAREVLGARGLRRASHQACPEQANFQTMFGHSSPRPLQQAVADAPLDRPLLILESETGSGKTEAAVMRFTALWRAGIVDGLYFAVPTRAAAKQLHGRISKALDSLLPWAPTVLAVPGYYRADEVEGQYIGDFEVFWEDEPDEEERAARWSAESTRHYLSSTAAVGTVDQALLSALKVKWAHLRGASLARSLLVVDEVHASDSYMTRLLHTLLRGHLDLGGHALLMSATLGATARTTFTGSSVRDLPAPDEAEKAPYPALTLAGNGTPDICPIGHTGQSKAVSMRVEAWMSDPAQIAQFAYSQARQGAKVLVIRNTVATAQEVFENLLNQDSGELALTVEGIPTLHHSRFAVEDRGLLDDAVEFVLGKGGRPDNGQVVIGTQTLEQSLDIDADILISDLCPVDVLLQRIGRLHRHADTVRPSAFSTPNCIVLTPEDGLEIGLGGGLLSHGLGMSENGGIYRNLLAVDQTRSLIIDHPVWQIPDMNRMLVERGTHPDVLQERANVLGDTWLTHEQQTWGLAAAEDQVARRHELDRQELFDEQTFPDLDEKVRTRLGEDGPRISLDQAVRGPFGKPVKTFNLPAFFFQQTLTKEEIEQARAEQTAGGLILHVGTQAFLYDRTGIRPMETEE